MFKDTLKSLGISLAAIFIVTFILMGFDLVSSVINLIIIILIIVNLCGLMYWWHITLNAVSLVNLVMAVGKDQSELTTHNTLLIFNQSGISVEFCSHLTRAFSVNVGANRIDRARYSTTIF